MTLTYNCGTGDCYGSVGAGLFDNSGGNLYVSTESDSINQHLRTWFPFASITLSRNARILSATLKVTATTTSGANTTNIKVGCEAADSPANPANVSDLLGRSLTTALLSTSIAQYVNATVYSYDITTAVQEILARAGWAYNNTIAAIIDSNDTTPRRRQIASANSGVNMAQLVIVPDSFVPRSGGMV